MTPFAVAPALRWVHDGLVEETIVSVAFKKEDSADTASETVLPDRPISQHPNLVTAEGLSALERLLAEARVAVDAAAGIEDINERRRQQATPLRDVRYLIERVRTAQVIDAPMSGRRRGVRRHRDVPP